VPSAAREAAAEKHRVRRHVVWVAPLVLFASPLRAQDPRADRARAQYVKAQAAYDGGDYRGALQRFAAAYAEKPVPALLFNIGQCHRKLGELDEAAKVYRAFLAAQPDSPHAQQARSLLAQVDSEIAARAPALDPPEPVHEALPAGGSASDVQRAPPAAVAMQPAPAVRARARWPTIAAAGAAAALFAGGVVEALASRSSANQLDQLHRQGAVDPAVDRQLRDDANAKASRSKLLYVASGVAAAAGVAFWFAF
jgi:tetratricopeptide (TPR) repeat protein